MIEDVQQKLHKEKLDGWLLYDFRRTNDLACSFLKIPEDQLLTRRFFYWIPVSGEPIKIVHSIEPFALDHLPGKKVLYQTWQEWESQLKNALNGIKRIAMEYSPRGMIPTVSKVDGGTLDLVRENVDEIVSSADIIQYYTSVLTDWQLKSHLYAAKVVDQTVEKAWNFIKEGLGKVTEYEVQQFILEEFEKNDCITSDPPICAINEHSADPHYCPTKDKSSVINKSDFILIDLWCKQKGDSTVYADITRVGVAADKATEKQIEIFLIVRKAQNEALNLIKSKVPLMGWQIDEACRSVIEKAGYGKYFIHRTGHNIGTKDHGPGANIDNFETQDMRQILPGTCFSIEPGIYLPGEFGVRLEYDVYVHLDGEVEVTGGQQETLKLLVSS